ERGVDGSADHEAGRGPERAGADHVDDHAAAARLHDRDDLARHPHVAEKLQRPVLHPGFVAELEEFARTGAAGVVDQDIDAAELAAAALDHRLDRVGPGQVSRGGDDASAGVGGGHRFLQRLLAARAHQHAGALGQQRKRDGASDAFAAAGYDRDFVLEPEIHFALLIAGMWDRIPETEISDDRLESCPTWKMIYG